MTTALVLITDSLKEIGVLAEGDTPSAAMVDDALRALNRLMALISNDQSFAYYQNMVSRPLTGETSFTIGPTGDVVTDRPISIETAFVDRNGISYPVRVIDNVLWDGIIYKGIAGANTAYVYYEATMPNGIVHVWPLATGCTLNLRVVNVVASFATSATVLSLPPGYEECLTSNLAVRLAPQYPAGILSPVTIQYAKSSLKQLQRKNNVIPTMKLPSVVTGRNNNMGSLANFLGGV
jgi:hypothetical protein